MRLLYFHVLKYGTEHNFKLNIMEIINFIIKACYVLFGSFIVIFGLAVIYVGIFNKKLKKELEDIDNEN